MGLSLISMFAKAGDGKGWDDTIQDWDNVGAVGVATVGALADGDDSTWWGMTKFALDFMAASDILDGDSSMLSKGWAGFRAGSMASHAVSTVAPDATLLQRAFAFAGGAGGALLGAQQWGAHWEGHTGSGSPAQSRGYNVPFVPFI